jgi:sulfide:quinone oxidoreductase
MSSSSQFKVLIVGGGVAGLEGALALRDLGRERVAVTMLAPDPEFVYRPLRVREPFAGPAARHYRLDELARDIEIELKQDALASVDPERRVVHTEAGDRVGYDALLLALGARPSERFRHALTLDDRRLDEQLHGLIQDVEGGHVKTLAFISPSQMPWPLPLYELALMTARRAFDMNQDASVTVVTPEDAPLALFGDAASAAVAQLLANNGIAVIASTHCDTPRQGEVSLRPGGSSLYVERIVALPELFGPSTPGLPKHDGHGFISIDPHCKVLGVESVYAAGDATDFAVKHGGVASQQADIAAESIAALAGAPVQPRKFEPVIHGVLLGGDRPLYLTAHVTGGHGSRSQATDHPTWSPGAKIAAKYLGPYLESRDRAALR